MWQLVDVQSVIFIGNDNFLRNRMYSSKFFLHSHPKKQGKISLPILGGADILVTDYLPQTIFGLSDHGLLIYKKPNYKNLDSRNAYLLYHAEVLKINILNEKTNLCNFENLIPYSNLSFEEQQYLRRKFMSDTGMIVDEALPDDKKGLERVVKKMLKF